MLKPLHLLSICFCLASLITPTYAATTLKIATLSPEGSSWMKKMRAGAAEIEKKTEGRVKFKFYPGGVMGSDQSVLRKIKIRQLSGGAITSGALIPFYPDNQIYNLPLTFESLEEVALIREKLDAEIMTGLEKSGWITFGFAGGGFAYLMSKNKPVKTIEDLKDLKIWVPDNDPISIEAMKSFDITPIPLAISDVLTGLQTGLIDTLAAPPIAAIALQWHTQVKYLTKLPLLYIYGLLAVDAKAFNKLSDADQAVVRDVLGKVFVEMEKENLEDSVEALAALEKQGIEFVTPDEAAQSGWNERGEIATKRLIAVGNLSSELVERVKGWLTEHRAQ